MIRDSWRYLDRESDMAQQFDFPTKSIYISRSFRLHFFVKDAKIPLIVRVLLLNSKFLRETTGSSNDSFAGYDFFAKWACVNCIFKIVQTKRNEAASEPKAEAT